jgi:hypothetical protein
MNVWEIAKRVGSAALQVGLPGTGSLIVAAVNEFLPEGSKLPSDATGKDVESVVSQMPPPIRAALLEKQFDVEIVQIQESNSTVRVMLESDAKIPHTTRPYIAKQAFHVIAFVSVVVVLIWAYGVVMGEEEVVAAVMGGWQFILAVTAPLVILLHAYFGILKQEHRQKLNAANGEITSSAIEKLMKKVKL